MFRCNCLLACSLAVLAVVAFEGRSQTPAAKAAFGDPLPAGALARLGQDRWLHGVKASNARFLGAGKTVLTSCDDGTFRVFEFPSGKEIRRIIAPPDIAKKGSSNHDGIAVSKDGKTLAVGFMQERFKLHLFDLAGNKAYPPLQLPEARPIAVFSPDGGHLAILLMDGTVRIWDWVNGKEALKFAAGNKSPAGGFVSRSYTPDGKAFILGGLNIDKGSVSSVISLYDPANGKLMRTLYTAKDGPTLEATVSPDGKFIVVGATTEKEICIIDLATGRVVLKLNVDLASAGRRTMVFDNDGTKLYIPRATGKANPALGLVEWDLATGKQLRTWDVPNSASLGAQVITSAGAISPDGNTMVVAGPGPLFFDITPGKKVTLINEPTDALAAVRFLPDGKTLLTMAASSRSTGSVRRWDAGDGKDLGSLGVPLALDRLTVSADGKRVAGIDKNRLVIMDVSSGKELGSSAIKAGPVTALSFSSDGKLLAAQGPGPIQLYESPSAQPVRPLNVIQPADNKLVIGKKPAIAANGPAPTFSNRGTLLAAVADPKTIGVWDAARGERIGSLTLGEIPVGSSLTFSRDDRCLIIPRSDGATVFHDLATGQTRVKIGQTADVPKEWIGVQPRLLPKELQAGPGVALSPDGKILARAGFDGGVCLWDIITGQKLHEFKGHNDLVNGIAFSPDGKMLATASADGTAMIWDVGKYSAVADAPGSQNQKALTAAELDACWKVLVEKDSAKAWVKMCDLTAAAKDSVAFIKARIQSATPVDMRQVEGLIVQLDAKAFKVREEANNALLKLGDGVVEALEKALATNPPLEAKQRLEKLRTELTSMALDGERLRAYRAIEVLELIGTPEARQVLETLAGGARGALITRTAAEALMRLRR